MSDNFESFLTSSPPPQSIFSGLSTHPTPPPHLTIDDIRAVMDQLKQRPEMIARLVGRRYDIYDMLIDMGCSFETRDDGQRVPVPVIDATLSVALVFDENAIPGVVREEYADGRIARTYMQSRRTSEWFVIDSDEDVGLGAVGR